MQTSLRRQRSQVTDYKVILKTIRETGHEFASFVNPPLTDKYAILRHDIDFSIYDALEMAKVENSLGVKATYFTLLTAPYYNPLADDNVAMLKQIVALDHEVGLHYDASGFEHLDDTQRRSRVATLASTLGDHISQDVRCIAQHKPASTTIRPTFPDFIDAYEPRFFNEIPYISDSRRMFRIKDVFDFIKATSKFQILIHPLWWKAQPTDREAIFAGVQEKITSDASQLCS